MYWVYGDWDSWCEVVRKRRLTEAGVLVSQLRESGIRPEDHVTFRYSCIGSGKDSAESLSGLFIEYDQVDICEHQMSQVFEITGVSDSAPYTAAETYQWIGFMVDSCRSHEFQFEAWSVTAAKLGACFDSSIGTPSADAQQVISDSLQHENLTRRLSGATRTLTVIRNRGVTQNRLVPLECFFYADAKSKIEALSASLSKLGYVKEESTKIPGPGPVSVRLTSPAIQMAEEELHSSIRMMCELAANLDCVFDGWGTQTESNS